MTDLAPSLASRVLEAKKRAAIRRARSRLTQPVSKIVGGGGVDPAPPTSAGVDVPLIPSIPLPSDERFGIPPLPDRFTSFRPAQWEAIEQVVEAFNGGARAVFCQAPPGTGKSLLGETVRRLVDGKAVYVATTKALQDQMAESFPYARVLKGRSNYRPTGGQVDLWGVETKRVSDQADVTCADCTKGPGESACRWCPVVDECPYTVAKRRAMGAELAVLNTAYWLADSNLGPAKFHGRDLCIIDEADTLEGELMGLVEVRISKARQRALRLDMPPRKTVESTWGPWVDEEAIPRVEKRMMGLPPMATAKASEIREAKGLAALHDALKVLSKELAEDPGSWVFSGYERGEIEFKPVRVSKWGEQYVWRHAKRFLLMSATIISAQEMAESLGLGHAYAVVDVPMQFPVENRQVKVVPVAEMSNKLADVSWPKMATAIEKLLPMHEGERVLVHTVSYKLADYLWTELRRRVPGRPVFRYGNSGQKDQALQRYLSTPGAVLLAPSMDRGVDLPGDACRVTVIAKIPYPNLGDKQVSKRLHTSDGQSWYSVQTVRSLVQMTGRGVRSEDDHCVTYVFDGNFMNSIWRKSRMMLPGWWVEALDFRTDARKFIEAAR